MLTLKAIRRKIKAVRNIQKITRAMKMVAAAKLKRVQERVGQSRPYSDKLQELVEFVFSRVNDSTLPFLVARPTAVKGFVIFTGEKGLCGSFNNNVIRLAVRTMEDCGKGRFKILGVGRKGNEFFQRRGYPIDRSYSFPGVNAPSQEFLKIADSVWTWFESGEVDEVQVIYCKFKSALHQEPRVVRLLPAGPAEETEESDGRTARPDTLFEPPPDQLLGVLIPRYVRHQVFQFLLESMASEQGARMTAMTAATDNASELLDSLTLSYNKARQWAITRELLDIVGGAEALKQIQ